MGKDLGYASSNDHVNHSKRTTKILCAFAKTVDHEEAVEDVFDRIYSKQAMKNRVAITTLLRVNGKDDLCYCYEKTDVATEESNFLKTIIEEKILYRKLSEELIDDIEKN